MSSVTHDSPVTPLPVIYDQAVVRAARTAVRTFYGLRSELADLDIVHETAAEILRVSRVSVARGTPITDAEWVSLAQEVDDACDECDLPRLFDLGESA